MIAASSAFLRYVERAREGRTGLWRLAVGIVLIVVLWAASTLIAFFAGVFMGGFVVEGGTGDPWAVVNAFFVSPPGVATALATFVGLAGGVLLVVKLVHRRPSGSVLGASGRLSWRDLSRGFAASLIATGLAEIASAFMDPSFHRSEIGIGAWLLWVVPLTLFLFVQVAAEELAFRGYLLQSLAARFRSPLVWALLPILLFTALHWDAQSAPAIKAAILVSIAAFAVTATILVVRTGNLGAGLGVHLGLNMFGILFVSHMSWLSGAALFASQPLDTGNWSPLDAVLIAASGIASFALVLLLLLYPRSPLRVGEA